MSCGRRICQMLDPTTVRGGGTHAVCSFMVHSCSQKIESVASVTFYDHRSFTIQISIEYKLIS